MKVWETKKRLAEMLYELENIRGAMDKLVEYERALHSAIDQLGELANRMQWDEEKNKED